MLDADKNANDFDGRRFATPLVPADMTQYS